VTTSRCRNCNVPLADYPRARDGFCVPSHAEGGDNRLEMEAYVAPEPVPAAGGTYLCSCRMTSAFKHQFPFTRRAGERHGLDWCGPSLLTPTTLLADEGLAVVTRGEP
jgi:hypothetical protein